MLKTYVNRTEAGFAKQLEHFLNKISIYATLLGLDANKIKALNDDLPLVKYMNAVGLIFKQSSIGVTEFKYLLRHGKSNLGPLPGLPTLPTPTPKLTSAGVEIRFRDIIQDVVGSSAVTQAILEDLGIAASQKTIDLATATPDFHLEYSSGGYPLIVWTKDGFDGIEIWKSTDGTNFEKLDKDFKPDYTDKSNLPAVGKAEKWYYKLIYLQDESHIGQWTDVKSILVGQ